MKRTRHTSVMTFLAAVLFVAGNLFAQADSIGWGPKADLSLRSAWGGGRSAGGTRLAAVESGPNTVRVLVLFDGPPVDLPGFRMTASGGEVATGELDLDYLPQFASSPSVRYVRAERRLFPNDDVGVRSVRAPRTSSRLGVTGKGVLIGVIDTGIDWGHPDFIGPDGKTRIEAILDLSEPAVVLRSGEHGSAGPYGGIAVYRDEIDQALQGQGTIRERDYIGHGTHVAGTAAASPSADTINALGGVATGASIVAIKAVSTPRDSSFSDGNILKAIAFLDSLAYFRGMPWVANLSLGGVLGSHDGTDLMELNLHNFVKNNDHGQSIVVAAGNSLNSNAHAEGDFTEAVDGETELLLNVTGGTGRDDIVQIEIWLSTLHPGLKFDLFAPGGDTIATVADDENTTLITDHGVAFLENAYGGVQPLSGDKLISIVLTDLGATNQDTTGGNTQLATGVWRIVMHSAVGSWDAYVAANYGTNVAFASHQTQSGTINVPGTSERLITVGAYNARSGWWSLNGGVGSLGQSLGDFEPGTLAYFSSVGPTRDGRMKPEITAPGRWVLGPVSSDAWPGEPLSIFNSPRPSSPLLLIAADSLHASSQGTSFSAPHVAGVVALLLEADSSLNNNQIKQLLTATAATDSQTVGAPDNSWGYGRVNAAGAVAMALGITSDTVRFRASTDPPDTLRTESFKYTLNADFRGSVQALTSYRLRISWPVASLRLSATPDSLAIAGNIKLSANTDSITAGVLNVSALALEVPPDSFALLELEFAPRGAAEVDGVQVNFETLSLTGDLAGGDILGSLAVSQAAPLSFRLEGVCPLAGDIDGNGKRDIFDLLALLKIISHRNEATFCSDLNGSGKTDIFDLLELLKMLKSI